VKSANLSLSVTVLPDQPEPTSGAGPRPCWRAGGVSRRRWTAGHRCQLHARRSRSVPMLRSDSNRHHCTWARSVVMLSIPQASIPQRCVPRQHPRMRCKISSWRVGHLPDREQSPILWSRSRVFSPTPGSSPTSNGCTSARRLGPGASTKTPSGLALRLANLAMGSGAGNPDRTGDLLLVSELSSSDRLGYLGGCSEDSRRLPERSR
jgi:hypothetical protein